MCFLVVSLRADKLLISPQHGFFLRVVVLSNVECSRLYVYSFSKSLKVTRRFGEDIYIKSTGRPDLCRRIQVCVWPGVQGRAGIMIFPERAQPGGRQSELNYIAL